MSRLFWLMTMLAFGACAMADNHERTITVTGTGHAEIAPDRATLQVSIVARHKTVAAAQAEAASVAARILELTDDMDIERSKVDTTGASVRPDYRWNRSTEQQELIGYIAERQMSIEIEDLDKLGALVEGAVEAGVNQVMPPQLDSSKRRDAYRQALRAAAEDARLNAEQLADALDATLGGVIRIDASQGGMQPPVPYPMQARALAMESDAAQTYNPADLSFAATVTVIFALTD